MREGTCSYSGLVIPKGSGMTFVRSDGKSMLYATKKVEHFVDSKIKARFIKWTQQARTLLKKQNTVKETKIEIPTVVKIIRGFPSVPAHIIKERQERRALEKEQEKSKVKKDELEGRKSTKVTRGDMRKKN